MKTLETLDPWQLPRVHISKVRNLPDDGGLYFAFYGSEMLYVGKTEKGLRSRWKQNHHRLAELQAMGDVYLAYWVCGLTGEHLDYAEMAAIAMFQPRLNFTPCQNRHSERGMTEAGKRIKQGWRKGMTFEDLADVLGMTEEEARFHFPDGLASPNLNPDGSWYPMPVSEQRRGEY